MRQLKWVLSLQHPCHTDPYQVDVSCMLKFRAKSAEADVKLKPVYAPYRVGTGCLKGAPQMVPLFFVVWRVKRVTGAEPLLSNPGKKGD